MPKHNQARFLARDLSDGGLHFFTDSAQTLSTASPRFDHRVFTADWRSALRHDDDSEFITACIAFLDLLNHLLNVIGMFRNQDDICRARYTCMESDPPG